MSITISDALRRIKALKGELHKWRGHLIDSANYNTQHPPVFSFEECREKYNRASKELVSLQAGVQVANATSTISLEGKEVPLCWAICFLSELKSRISVLESMKTHETRERSEADTSQHDQYIKSQLESLQSSNKWYDLSYEERRTARMEVVDQPLSMIPSRYHPRTETHICEVPYRERMEMIDDLKGRFAAVNSLLEAANHQVRVRIPSEH